MGQRKAYVYLFITDELNRTLIGRNAAQKCWILPGGELSDSKTSNLTEKLLGLVEDALRVKLNKTDLRYLGEYDTDNGKVYLYHYHIQSLLKLADDIHVNKQRFKEIRFIPLAKLEKYPLCNNLADILLKQILS